MANRLVGNSPNTLHIELGPVVRLRYEEGLPAKGLLYLSSAKVWKARAETVERQAADWSWTQCSEVKDWVRGRGKAF